MVEGSVPIAQLAERRFLESLVAGSIPAGDAFFFLVMGLNSFMYQKFSHWLEGRRDRTVRPHGIPFVNDPFRRGEPKRNDPGLSLPKGEGKGSYRRQRQYFMADLERRVMKFLRKKSKEKKIQIPKNTASKIMEWARAVDPSGGSYMPWIVSQIVMERVLVTQQSATFLHRLLSRYLQLKPMLRDHPNPLAQELHSKFLTFSPDEVEARLALLDGA